MINWGLKPKKIPDPPPPKNPTVLEKKVEYLEAAVFELQNPYGVLLIPDAYVWGCKNIAFKYTSKDSIKTAAMYIKEYGEFSSTKVNGRFYIKNILKTGETEFYLVEDNAIIKIDMIDDDIATWHEQ